MTTSNTEAAPIGDSEGEPQLVCFRDATCANQWGVQANDAFVFDPAGLSLLVVVGGSTPPACPPASPSVSAWQLGCSSRLRKKS